MFVYIMHTGKYISQTLLEVNSVVMHPYVGYIWKLYYYDRLYNIFSIFAFCISFSWIVVVCGEAEFLRKSKIANWNIRAQGKKWKDFWY